jgi:predicted lysophospholipase L1 biosynthesis ABC-type transport system permease subunit
MLPGNATDIYLFRVDRPASLPAVEAALHNALPGLAIGSGPTGGDVDVLARVSNLPLVLAGVLALLSLATLAHLIVTAVRARRQEFAVLKTLGFVGLQVRQTVAWYATTVALVALVLALPIGYVTGRIGWGLLANEMGFLSDPTIKVWQVLAIVPLALVAVNMIGVVPSRSAASAAPALEFRRE